MFHGYTSIILRFFYKKRLLIFFIILLIIYIYKFIFNKFFNFNINNKYVKYILKFDYSRIFLINYIIFIYQLCGLINWQGGISSCDKK